MTATTTYAVVSAGYTNNAGYIEFTVNNTDSQDGAPGRDVHLIAYAWTSEAYVVDGHNSDTKYAVQTGILSNVSNDQTVTFGTLVPGSNNEAWEAVDAIWERIPLYPGKCRMDPFTYKS